MARGGSGAGRNGSSNSRHRDCRRGAGRSGGGALSGRAGHRVTIFERFEEPTPVGSGLILQPTGLTVLHALACWTTSALGSRIDRLYGADATSGRTVLDVRYDA